MLSYMTLQYLPNILVQIANKVKIKKNKIDGQSECLGVEHASGTCDFLSECCCLKFAVLYLWGALSDERMGLQFAV
jgi:hypothetical protein